MVAGDTGLFDTRRRYCRRLGHEVPFGYCRTTVGATPCASLRGCWGSAAGMEAAVESAAADAVSDPAPDKRLQLAELIRRARSA